MKICFSCLLLFHNILHELPVFQTVKTINIKVEFKKHLAKVSKERFFLVWINLEDCFKVCLESKSFRSFTIYIYPTCLYVAFRGANIIISVNWTDRLHSRMLLTFFFLKSQGQMNNILSISLLVDRIPMITNSLMSVYAIIDTIYIMLLYTLYWTILLYSTLITRIITILVPLIEYYVDGLPSIACN